jgi:PAS domain S-box-containing protein
MGSAGQTSKNAMGILGCLIAVVGLFLMSRINYLLFHALAELFSIVVASGVFIIAWNSRHLQENGFFLFVGIASLCVAGLDFFHLLAYKNMGVFPGADANLPTQLWVASRYLQGVAFCIAPLFIHRRASVPLVAAGFAGATLILLAAIFSCQLFPACFVEGRGLTPFKIGSEYLVAALLACALLLIRRRKESFDPYVLNRLTAAVVCFIAAGMAFTLYADVFGISNMVGHLLKVAGFYCIYRGVVATGLTRPYDLLFRELKESEERYRHLYEETPVMLHSIDPQGRLANVSNYWQKSLGYGSAEVLGRKWVEFLTPESRCHAEETVIPEFFRTGVVQDIPYQLTKKGGEVIDVLLTATAERDGRGEIVRSLAVMVDVTERNVAQRKVAALVDDLSALNHRLEEANEELAATNDELEVANEDLVGANRELEIANRDLEAFNATVSHDLRNPLAIINGYCQLLQELYRSSIPPQCLEFIDMIHAQTGRMNTLISTLLSFARVGRVELRRETVDLSTMARDILHNHALQEPGRQVQVSVEDGVVVQGDPSLLQIVLENLLDNAWKYTGKAESPVIRFGATFREGRHECFVRDNGAGFDMSQVDRLFNPFQRLHEKQDFEGNGIGLVTVQRIVQRHGGRLWAEGEVGRGAVFYFDLGVPY